MRAFFLRPLLQLSYDATDEGAEDDGSDLSVSEDYSEETTTTTGDSAVSLNDTPSASPAAVDADTSDTSSSSSWETVRESERAAYPSTEKEEEAEEEDEEMPLIHPHYAAA